MKMWFTCGENFFVEFPVAGNGGGNDLTQLRGMEACDHCRVLLREKTWSYGCLGGYDRT